MPGIIDRQASLLTGARIHATDLTVIDRMKSDAATALAHHNNRPLSPIEQSEAPGTSFAKNQNKVPILDQSP